MHNDSDEQLIMAYVDGELPAEERRAVQRRLEAEPGLRDLERGFRESRNLLREAFSAEIERPVPQQLLGLFAEPGQADAGPPADNVISLASFARRPAFRRVRQYAALAACLVLAVGLGAGTMLAPLFAAESTGGTTAPALLAVADPNTYRLLDQTPSHEAVAWKSQSAAATGRLMPVATFQDRTGRYCRQFIQSVTPDGSGDQVFAIACRDASGMWSPAFAMIAPKPEKPGPGAYVPATGASDAAFSDAAKAMMAAPPLAPKAEEKLLKSWTGQ